MPTFTNNTFSSFYKRIFQISQTTNTGADGSTRAVETGDGATTSISLSDDVLQVKPVNDDTSGAMLVKNSGGSNILAVDTAASKVLVGVSQVPATVQYKEMGLYNFSPYEAGGHYPLLANGMMDNSANVIRNFGTDANPALELDISGEGDGEARQLAVACYWYLEHNITLNSIRYTASCESVTTLDFRLGSYTVNTSSGDLSVGALNAHVDTVSVTHTGLTIGTLSLDAADIDASQVVIGFVSNNSNTGDITCAFNIEYFIR